MRLWSAIFNIFGALIMIMYSLAYFLMIKTIDRDFDQARLNLVIDYATEATFASALKVEDIGIDYENLSVVSINPGNTLDIFETLMCINYDLSLSEENKKYIESSIATIVLSGSDGFYITQSVQDDTTPGNSVKGNEFALRWSPKIPYLYKYGNKTYGLNIAQERWLSISDTGTIEIPSNPGYPIGITKSKALEIANSQITNTIIQEIENKNANKDPFGYNFFLPVEATKRGVNPIEGPGILVLMQNAKFASSERMSAVSVSGYKVTNRINVVAFRQVSNGRKFYCYEGQMDPVTIGTTYIVENYYKTTKEAALAGYSPNYELLAKKISKR